MTRVLLSVPLRGYTGGVGQVDLRCTAVAECLEALERRYPGIEKGLRDESGDLSPSVNLYVNGEDVRHHLGLATPLRDGDELRVIVAIAGG